MRISKFVLTAAVAFGLSAAAGACTGDVWVDARVGEINDYGVRYREPFVNEMVTYYGAPRPYVIELLGQRHWSPGDVYYACSFAHSMGRPCSEVADRYEHNRAGGWATVVQSYNVSPSSAQFVAFRHGFVESYGRWGQTIVIDRDTHVRWDHRSMRAGREVTYANANAYGHDQHGHSGGHYDHGNHGGRGPEYHEDHGHGGHGHGHDKNKDNGQGNEHDHGNH